MSADQRYEEVRRLVLKMCYKFKKKYGGDIDELIAMANYQYTVAVSKHNPERAKFSTYIGYVVWMKLLDEYFTKVNKDVRLRPLGRRDLPQSSRFDLHQFTQELGPDAHYAVRLATSPKWPDHIPAKSRRKLVRDILRDQGWSEKRIESTFAQVQEALA